MSNAAVKSRRMRRDGEPVLAVISRSFVTLTRADSVEMKMCSNYLVQEKKVGDGPVVGKNFWV